MVVDKALLLRLRLVLLLCPGPHSSSSGTTLHQLISISPFPLVFNFFMSITVQRTESHTQKILSKCLHKRRKQFICLREDLQKVSFKLFLQCRFPNFSAVKSFAQTWSYGRTPFTKCESQLLRLGRDGQEEGRLEARQLRSLSFPTLEREFPGSALGITWAHFKMRLRCTHFLTTTFEAHIIYT